MFFDSFFHSTSGLADVKDKIPGHSAPNGECHRSAPLRRTSSSTWVVLLGIVSLGMTGCYTQLHTNGHLSRSAYDTYHQANPEGVADSLLEGDSLSENQQVIVHNYYDQRSYYRGYPRSDWDIPYFSLHFSSGVHPRYYYYHDRWHSPYWWDRPRYRSHRDYHRIHPSYPPDGGGVRPPSQGGEQPKKRLFNQPPTNSRKGKGQNWVTPPSESSETTPAPSSSAPSGSAAPAPEQTKAQESGNSGDSEKSERKQSYQPRKKGW